MKSLLKRLFRFLYSRELAELRALAEDIKRPTERLYTIKAFDPADMEFLTTLHTMNNDPVVRFFFVMLRNDFVSKFGELKTPDAALMNQYFGRIAGIEEIIKYIQEKDLEYLKKMEENAEEIQPRTP